MSSLSEPASEYLSHIHDAACRCLDWSAEAGGIEATVYGNELVRSAVERQLLIVAEAASRLTRVAPDFVEATSGTIDWKGVRGFGNILRHRYDDLDSEMLVAVLQHRLQPLIDFCRDHLTP